MGKKSSKREVLYLKYRPQSLSEVIGQEHITKTLLSALSNNRISHAYLFSGPRGTGKTTIARILAKNVNCQKPIEGEPCNKCEFCQEIMDGKSMDVIEIDAASNRGIDEIRELRDKIKFAPAKAKYKVFIIDEVHMLTREAFNALLKTLEEPPSHALFILATTEIHKVPETIISRCQRFDFKRIKMVDIIKYLERVSKNEKISIEKEALSLIAANSSGALRDAVNLLDQASSFGQKITISSLRSILGLTDIDDVYKFVDFLTNKETKKSLELINEILESGYDLVSFGKKLIEHLRYILIFKTTGNDDLIEVTAEQLLKIKKQALNISITNLLSLIKIFLKTNRKTNFTNLPQLPLELAVLEFNQDNISEGVKINKNQKRENEYIVEEVIVKKESRNNQTVKNDQESFKKIIKEWDSILEKTKKNNHSIRAFLKACEPSYLDKDTLYLNFLYAFHKDKINEPKNRSIVEDCIREITGLSYKIKCQFKPDEFNKKKGNDKEEDNDGRVEDVLEVFGGEIVE